MQDANAMPPSSIAAVTVESFVAVSDEQVSCALEGETIVLSLKDGVYYGMNPSATRIWELAQQPRSVRAISDILLQEYDEVDAERCVREVTQLLEQLREWGMIRVVDDALSDPHQQQRT